MTGLYIEKRALDGNPITPDIARHLYVRSLCGHAAIVAEQPVAFLSALRKQWIKVENQLRYERSARLSSAKVLELSHELSRVQALTFTAKPPAHEQQVGVQVGTIVQFLEWAPECKTLYVTSPITNEKLHLIAAWMPKGGLVVIYEQE